MARTLGMMAQSAKYKLRVAVTGMHLSAKYGTTVHEIEAAGLEVLARIATEVDETSGKAMAAAIADTIRGLVTAFESWRPELVLLLGDRGEMLAGAIAAIHLNIPVVHLHGGERSGSVDEPVRHAISKLSHFHFVANLEARDRLLRMGEESSRVFVTGAPGIDGLQALASESREELCRQIGLDPRRPICLIVFHPVTQEAMHAGRQASAVLDGVLATCAQAIVLQPNADAGGDAVRAALARYQQHNDVRLLTNMSRARFVSWMATADAMVGNSSSGIIEAASLGLWVVNVGNRQQLRERSGNVVDVDPNAESITATLADVLVRPRQSWQNVYGDGCAAERIVALLETLPLSDAVLSKVNAY
jgi:GDP/UDP-N,N'-diacetylbacillosamine 2-epimerase (hydrolysing)